MAKIARGDNSPPPEPVRTYQARALSQLLPAVTRVAYKRRSPAAATLMAEWANIVGPRLAAETTPRRLSSTQLTIACSGPMAMELTHLSNVLIERINTTMGQRLVERLRFVQDFQPSAEPPSKPYPKLEISPIQELPAGALNDSLAQLRALIKQRSK